MIVRIATPELIRTKGLFLRLRGRGDIMKINIYWNDLTPEKQRDIAELMGMAAADVAGKTNWELIPMAVVGISEEEEV